MQVSHKDEEAGGEQTPLDIQEDKNPFPLIVHVKPSAQWADK